MSDLNDTYVRKAGEVTARKWDGTIRDALNILDWLTTYNVSAKLLETRDTARKESPELVIHTDDGNKHARPGNWIVYEDGTWLLFTAGTFRRQYEKKVV